MISYFFVNFACFAASYANTPGWRPSFKYYNKWLSLAGGIGCLILMFLINWLFGIITIILSALVYGYLAYTDPDVNWGSAPEALKYDQAHKRYFALIGCCRRASVYMGFGAVVDV